MNANISANDFVTNANCTILNEFRVALFETYFLEHLIHYISVFERVEGGAYKEQNWMKMWNVPIMTVDVHEVRRCW